MSPHTKEEKNNIAHMSPHTKEEKNNIAHMSPHTKEEKNKFTEFQRNYLLQHSMYHI
jgi:hypothetical protein